MSEASASRWNPQGGITLYGRKPALEALLNPALTVHCLHLATSNRPSGIISQLLKIASERKIEVRHHDRLALSRISKNSKQDQGVALDIRCENFCSVNDFLIRKIRGKTLLALDGITNPQNVGMIIRSATAAGVDGLLYPAKGVAALGPLVIKASAGTVFRAPIIHCDAVGTALAALKQAGFRIAVLDSGGDDSLYDFQPASPTVFVLGSESEGISQQTLEVADIRIRIPMKNGVESLNVAVAAALVAFRLAAASP